MRCAKFVTLGHALWLSGLGLGQASSLADAALTPRQKPPRAGKYIYRGDGRSPAEIRRAGGMQPQGDGWADDEESFDINRHYRAGPNGCGVEDDHSDDEGWVFRTAYVSTASLRATAEQYGRWLYEFRATPNILDNGDSQGEVMALGGVHWRQIRRYTRMRDTLEHRVVEAAWLDNPEYDAATYETGPDVRHAHISEHFPGVLNGDSDGDSDAGSDSDSDSSGESTRRGPLYRAVDIWMDQTPGVFELYGGFPPVWTPYAPRADIPESDYPVPEHPATEHPATEPPTPAVPDANPDDAEDSLFGQTMRHLMGLGRDELTMQFPDGDEARREIYREFDRAACPFATGFGSNWGRSVRSRSGSGKAPWNDGSACGKADGGPQAGSKHGCCKMLTSFKNKVKAKKQTHGAGASTHTNVDVCKKKSPPNPPCTVVKAPHGECVAIPENYLKEVSGVKAHETGRICRFYLEPGCEGDYFEAGHRGMDTAHLPFNDKVVSLACDVPKTLPAPEIWDWRESREQLCSRLDELTVEFTLTNHWYAGTYDRIKIDFHGVGANPLTLMDSPSSGDHATSKIDMLDLFRLETVALAQIKQLRLLAEITNPALGGDAWVVRGFTVRGRCAGSGIKVALNKFAALNEQFEAGLTTEESPYHRDLEMWKAGVAPADWVPEALCSHLSAMNVHLEIADKAWAGTSNDLVAKVGAGSVLIASRPGRGEIYTVDVGLGGAYEADPVPIGQVGNVGILSQGGYSDGALPQEIELQGFCAGSHKGVKVKHVNEKWLYDGETLDVEVTPGMWQSM